AVPFVAWELDLVQAGLEDAEALGVDTVRLRWIALGAASLAAAAAVAVAGEIAFVGLVVPHVVRALTGPSHKTLLVLSALLGAAPKRLLSPDRALQPGAVMPLVGGPFCVSLLWRRRRALGVW